MTYRHFTIIRHKIVQFLQLVVSHFDLFELLCLGQHGQDVRLVHHGLHFFIEHLRKRKLCVNNFCFKERSLVINKCSYLDCVIFDIELTGSPA